MNYIFNVEFLSYSKPAKEVLIDLINFFNEHSKYTTNSFIWGTPELNTQPAIDCNTMLMIAPNPSMQWDQAEPIFYNRINIDKIVTTSHQPLIPNFGATKLSDMLPVINLHFGIELTLADIIDVSMPVTESEFMPCQVPLQIKAESLLFTGKAFLNIGVWGLNVEEVASINTSVFVVDHGGDQDNETWITRLNSGLFPVTDFQLVNSNFQRMGSKITSALIVNDDLQFLCGSLNYRITGPTGYSVQVRKTAIAIRNKVIVDIDLVLNSNALVAGGYSDMKSFLFRKTTHVNLILVSMQSASTSSFGITALVDLNDNFKVVAVKPSFIEVGFQENSSRRYTDIQPIFYNQTSIGNCAQFVQFEITASSCVLRFLDDTLTLMHDMPVLALSPINDDDSFFNTFKPSHFSFSAQYIGDQHKILMSVKQPTSLENTSGFSAYIFNLNGFAITPELTAWFGVVEITNDGVTIPSKFSSDTVSYRAARLPQNICAKTNSPVLVENFDATGYSGLRFKSNEEYIADADALYVLNLSRNAVLSKQTPLSTVVQQTITTVFDARAEEAFYFDYDGVKRSRGFIWHVVGLAPHDNTGLSDEQAKALTYAVFDVTGQMVLCRKAMDVGLAVYDSANNQSSSLHSQEITVTLVRSVQVGDDPWTSVGSAEIDVSQTVAQLKAQVKILTDQLNRSRVKTFTFESSLVWKIRHNFFTNRFSESILNDKNERIYAGIRYIDENEFWVEFTEPEAGSVTVVFNLEP